MVFAFWHSKILANGTMGQDFHGECEGFYTNGGNAKILSFPYNYMHIIHIPIAEGDISAEKVICFVQGLS